MNRLVGVFALGAACAIFCAGCISIPIGFGGSRAELVEEIVEPSESGSTRNKIALISLSGVISSAGGSGFTDGDSTIVEIKDQLEKAKKDDRVRAVVLKINSPGGSVTASDIIYRELTKFREEREIPVYVAMMDLAASGGYYAAMAADKIYANPTTLTGSIGVVATFPKLQPLTSKIGIEMRVIKSGAAKDIGSLWRDFAPGEREIFQGLIDDFYQRFLDIVAKGRPGLDQDTIRELADGRIYTARQAEDAGLIDGIKYLDEVIEAAIEAAGLDEAAVVVYKKPHSYKGHIYAKDSGASPKALLNIDADSILDWASQPRFQYLWMP